ncbi:hypothetical protein Vretimale_7707 [Volvox reticuliferus]|uniref:Uncharacterized protein n=1 Tax=Volvox reticuliferus TaxID=1737510 RepID=A0A8J4FJ23_9CHLO|nr:hypothetical protein Vretifemale_7809 [Volvox reticuliferus]GIM02912.1 hypothetical protein Vretimale_7707 [Volvox reticuliferus]
MKASGEAQDVILYRREALKSPDEVLSEARKNHSIFKANLVSGALRPSIRHVGLSRFQFGDGEFAASVESMQRMLAEKAARPVQLPEMQEPVQLTRTLSRSVSSRRNPFRSGRIKPRPVVSLGNMKAVCDGLAAGPDPRDDGGESPEEGASGHDPAMANDAEQQAKAGIRYLRLDSFFSATAIETPAVIATATATATTTTTPTAAATAFATAASGSGADTSRQWSTSHSVKPLYTPRVSQPPLASSGGGPLDSQGFWSGFVGGGAGSGNDEDAGDDDGDGDAGDDGIVDSLTSGIHFDGLALSQNPHRSDANSDESPESPYGQQVSTAPAMSSFSLFMRRSNIQSVLSPLTCGGSSGGAPPAESSTGRVDKMLQELRRFKTRGGPSGGSSGAAAAAAGPGYAGGGGGSGSGSARPSYNGSGRFDSPREMFTQRGRSVTLMNLPSAEEDGLAAVGDAGITRSSNEAADRGHMAHNQQQQGYRPQRGSASQLQLQLHVQVPLQSPVPSASSPSSGTPSPLIRQPSIVSGASSAYGSSMPFSPVASFSHTTAQMDSGGSAASASASSPQWAQKTFRSPTGDGERTTAAQSSLHNNLSLGLNATAALTSPTSPQSPLRGPFAGAAAALPSRTTAHGAPLDGWSSRPRGRSIELKRHSAVSNFFVNLLSPSTAPVAHAGPSTPV